MLCSEKKILKKKKCNVKHLFLHSYDEAGVSVGPDPESTLLLVLLRYAHVFSVPSFYITISTVIAELILDYSNLEGLVNNFKLGTVVLIMFKLLRDSKYQGGKQILIVDSYKKWYGRMSDNNVIAIKKKRAKFKHINSELSMKRS